MGDGTKENPYTREDVLRRVRRNGGTARGLDLSNRIFRDNVDLSDLNLSGIKLNFARLFRAKFDGSSLDSAELLGAKLQHATFNPLESKDAEPKNASLQMVGLGDADLTNAEFKRANLTAARFQEQQQTTLPTGESIIFPPAFLHGTDFRGANLFLTNFKGCYFYGTKFEGACIRGADIFEAHLEEADWGSYVIGEEEKKEELYFAVNVYRRLKVWYKNAGYDDIAAKFYYREMEASRKSQKLFSKCSFWRWTWGFCPNRHRLAAEALRALFGYGERWWNVVYWIGAVILLFAFTYLAVYASWQWWLIPFSWLLGLAVLFVSLKVSMDVTRIWWRRIPTCTAGFILLTPAIFVLGASVLSDWNFWDSLYFSTVSFTALGYGGWLNLGGGLDNDFIRGIGAFESLVGISMMALLLVTFFRKWTR